MHYLRHKINSEIGIYPYLSFGKAVHKSKNAKPNVYNRKALNQVPWSFRRQGAD
jgi:hypothetical protein